MTASPGFVESQLGQKSGVRVQFDLAYVITKIFSRLLTWSLKETACCLCKIRTSVCDMGEANVRVGDLSLLVQFIKEKRCDSKDHMRHLVKRHPDGRISSHFLLISV